MKTRSGSRRTWTRRALSFLLAAVMVLGILPGFPGAENSEAEAQWAEPYLNQLVEWGFIRADQANNPNMALTRADFMAIVNRAYGYKTPGETPFEDVEPNQWYYDDVGIAYNARYIVGTSPTTASPNNPLTRETAATVLGRNMMLQESPGEILDFTDARQISNWAMGTVKSSLEHYLISGYTDGTLRPKRNVSWGEMATMVTKLIGTPLQEPGDYTLGGVFGNVTITSSNVTLRDSVVSGDAYVTAGVGLGNVKMENVDVLGRIIASGTGRSEGGEASILLRNVTADELLIDNLQDDYVSVQVDGISDINRTTVRTSAYIEDNTPDGLGLKYISIEGDTYPKGEEPEGWEPIQVDLAGRIGEVVNRTPFSQVRVGKGTVEKLTVDEAATDSTVIIDRGAVVKELNLDTAAHVTGEGDIGHLVVNAPGCVIDIMPDEITIRPGITAIICGQEMDSVAAEEFSMDPLILAGYPEARDITPTGLEAAFMTNKAGTIYYAVSAVTDGSVGADDLIKPPSYGSVIVSGGSVSVSKGNEEVTAAISKLTPGGSYYLSAVLVDAKGNRSPVKVISFTTPDNTIPAFVNGYPYMSKVSPKDSVVVTKTTKDCKLYYALLPQGSVAPTENEMKTNAVAGALGYGVRDAYKNIEDVFRVNDQLLEEQTTYILYFFLMDADGVNKSKIISLSFTTDDETPPVFLVEPTVTSVQATSVGLTFRLNEDGTVYWVAIPANTMAYPKPEPGTDYEIAPPNSMYGKLQIANGMNIGTNGKSGKVACKANTDGTINVSGLQKEMAYDFYYVAKDNAGPDRNYSEIWKKITIYTLDTIGPVFSQSFSDSSSLDGKSDPRANTAIYIDVTEDVRYAGEGGGTSFLELYQAVKEAKTDAERNAAKNKLAASLYGAIKLHKIELTGSSEPPVVASKWQTTGQFSNNDDWIIDYTQATVEAHEGGIRITFPKSALHLQNGGQYYFTVTNVTDVSNNQNPLVPTTVDFHTADLAQLSKAAGHDLPVFLVEFARVDFSRPGVGAGDAPILRDAGGKPIAKPATGYSDNDYVRMDMSFRLTPISTETVADSISYDLLLWTYNQVKFDLYYRVVDPNGKKILDGGSAYPATYTGTDPTTQETVTVSNYLLPRLGGRDNVPDENGWIYLGNSDRVNPSGGNRSGRSVNKYFNGCGEASFPQLNKLSSSLRYEFVIHLTALGTIDEETNGEKTWRNWNGEVKFYANIAAGQSSQLDDLGGSLSDAKWKSTTDKGLSGGAVSIGRNDTRVDPVDTQELSRSFTDSRLPRFANNAPRFSPQATTVDVELSFSNPGTLYYIVGKADMGGSDHLPEVTTTRTLLSALSTSYTEGNNMLAVTGGNGLHYIRLTDALEAKDSAGNITSSTSVAPNKNGAEPMQPWMVGGIKEGLTTDDPEKENLIVSPLNQYIFDPQGQADTANTVNGSFPFKGTVIETLSIDGLQPETDYFIYFVLKGEADTLSHVYIYQFRTTKATKPKITLNNYADSRNSEYGASIKTDIDSKLQYVVFTRTDAETSFAVLQKRLSVSEAFARYNPQMWGSTGTGEIIDNGDGTYSMTVLDALLYKYNCTTDTEKPWAEYEGYSVFDVYADDKLKNELSSFLHNGYNTDFMGASKPDPVDQSGGRIDMKAEEVQNKLMNLQLGTDYIILAVAHVPEPNSTNPADYETFAAYAPIHIANTDAPHVISWDNSILSGKRTDTSFNGSVYIDFAPQLFLRADKSTILTSSNISQLSWTNQTDSVTMDVDETNNQKTTLVFNGPWHDGDYIRLPLARIYNSNTIPGNGTLVLRAAKETDGFRISIEYPTLDGTIVTDSVLIPYQAAATPLSVQFKVDESDKAAADAGVTMSSASQGAQTMTIPMSYANQRISILGILSPDDVTGTFFWSSDNPSIATVAGTTEGIASTARATLTALQAGETKIHLRVVNGEVDETFEFTVVVYGLTLVSATGAGSINEAGALVWDLAESNRGATLTLQSNSPLSEKIIVTSGTTEVTSQYLAWSEGSAVTTNSNRTQITISLIKTGSPSNGTQETVTIKVGGLECSFRVIFTGSETVIGANIPIAGVRRY